MRFIFLLILLAGVAIGILYPWATRNFSGHELGIWHVYEQGGFKPVTVPLKAADAPVRVLVDLTAGAGRDLASDRTVLTLTASSGGRTALASTLHFSNDPVARQSSPQIADKIFRDEAGVIRPANDGDYLFTVGPGDADDIRIKAVDLILRSDAAEPDGRAQPVGFSLIAVGFIGLLLAIRSGGRPQNPNSQPPPPRWGRAGSDRQR